ncbi:MAG: hypothetical protein JWM86_1931 [Thermoleophilia bacterium]|nr:hypothetical protein [Thermoleophilia bacterium]
MPSTRTCVLLALALACVASLQLASLDAVAQEPRAPRLELKPARFAGEIAPGTTSTVDLTLTNRIDDTLDVRFRVIDLEAGDGESFARPARRAPSRSARSWVAVPSDLRSMRPGQQVREQVVIRVPSGARPGAYAVALVASQSFSPIGSNDADTIGSRVEAKVNLGSTFVIVVPGDAQAAAKVVAYDSPRVIWSGDDPSFDATVENTGDTLLKLEAGTELSSFGAFAARTLRSAEQPTLPGGRRDLRMRWTDRPWIGWFTPRLVVVGGAGSGVRVEQDLPTVFVIPPWWVIALVVLAITVPVWSHRRRRRAMRAHMQQRRAERLDGDD